MMLRQIVAYVFRKKGGVIPISEFVFALSLDLKWFSPDQAESVLANAEREGLVQVTGDMVEPSQSFDIHAVEIPIDFKPDKSVFSEKTVLDRTIDRLSGVMEKQELIRLINEKQGSLGIVEPDAVALLVARMHGVSVSDLIDEAYSRLCGK